MMPSRTYSIKEVAEHFAVGAHTVLGWISGGELLALNVARKPGGRRPRWRITQEALEEFEVARSHKAPPPRKRKPRQSSTLVQRY